MSNTLLIDCVKAVKHYSTLLADDKRNLTKSMVGQILSNHTDYSLQRDFGKTSKHLSLDSALDRMNPDLLASIVYRIYCDTTTQIELNTVVRKVVTELSKAVEDDTDNVVGRGNKKLFAYPKSMLKYTYKATTTITPEESVKVEGVDDIKISGKAKTMDGFNVQETSEKVVAVARKLAQDDLDVGLSGRVQTILQHIEQAKEIVADKEKLNAKNRESLNSCVELQTMGDQCNEESIERLSTTHDGYATSVMPTSTSAKQDETKDHDVKPIVIEEQWTEAINPILKNSSGGKIKDINKLLLDHADLQTKSKDLLDEVNVLRTRATTVPINPTGDVKTSDMGTLKYKVVDKKASDVFTNPRTGRKIAQLNFNIPTLEWTDDKGKVVTHPYTPRLDENYQFRASHLISFLTAFVLRLNVWCHGHTGVGKTTLPAQIASRIGFPVFPLNLDSNLERADLTGQTTLITKEGTTVTKFEEGILPKAMIQPCFLVLDEIDAAKPDLLFVLQRATEGNGLLLTEDSGRLIKPHPLFRFVATANSRGQGDEHGVYAGVRPLNGALLNRFSMYIEVDYMETTEELAMLKKQYPLVPKDFLEPCVQFAKLCRKAFENGETSVPVSPRDTMNMCMLYQHFSTVLTTKVQATEFAVQLSVLNRCPLDNKQRIVELADRVFANTKFNIK